MKKFPKTIYAVREDGGAGTEYLSIRETAESDEFSETTVVAQYQLVEVGKVIVSREYRGGK